MKGLLCLMMLFLLTATGCSADSLAEYKKAVATTAQMKSGVQHMTIQLDLEMNIEGLSYEDIKNLSYFEQIEYSSDMQFDNSSDFEQVIVKTYTNIGGMGVDFKIYIKEDQVYMSSPMISGYMNLSENYTVGSDHTSQMVVYNEDTFEPIVEKWNEMLKEEDVLKQNKTYILTNDGQIKSTIYSIHADEEQLKILSKKLIEIIDDRGMLENIPADQFGFDKEEFQDVDFGKLAREFIDRIVLTSFDGKAYVDFDGRLVRNEFEVKLELKDAKPGEPMIMNIVFENEYDHLGEKMELDFPTVAEDEWIDPSDEKIFENFLPN